MWAVAAFAIVSVVLPGSLGAEFERRISLYNIHTKDTLTIVYKRDDRFIPEALEKLNWHLRDWRRNEPTKMDPEVIDLVWEIHRELGSRVPVHVISAYRSPATNAALRRSRGGQARRSQHMLGKAMDVRFPDVPVRRLRYSALLREQGGVGYYPTSATPFVHVDTGRVRHWPRMDRQELALLFPHGRTQHRPSSGGPISREDAIRARETNPQLAQRVAQFHVERHNGGGGGGAVGTRVASAAVQASAPQIVSRPRLAARPASRPQPYQKTKSYQQTGPRAQGVAAAAGHNSSRPALPLGAWQTTARAAAPPAADPGSELRGVEVAALDRASLAVAPSGNSASDLAPRPFRPTIPASAKALPEPARASIASDGGPLAQLASLIFSEPKQRSEPARRVVEAPKPDGWMSAPEFDEEHPEELFYRPFPIAPYITLTASADDPALRQMRAPDIERTLVMLVADGAEADPALDLNPGFLSASLARSQVFSAVDGLDAAAPTPFAPRPRAEIGGQQNRLLQLANR